MARVNCDLEEVGILRVYLSGVSWHRYVGKVARTFDVEPIIDGPDIIQIGTA